MNYVIIDAGSSIVLDNNITIDRYAAWETINKTITKVIETSNNIEYLKSKYNPVSIIGLRK
jgi:hypothetical protein